MAAELLRKSTDTWVLESEGIADTPLALRALPGQTANLLEARNSANVVVAAIGAGGDLTTSSLAINGAITGASETILGPASWSGAATAANGQLANILSLTELTTIAAAATTDTTMQIPANCIVIGVTIRVTVAIPTATAFNYGIAGATARYGTGIAVAAGTIYPGMDDGTRFYSAATAIRFTPNGTPGAATGRVRTTIHYVTLTPPSS